MDFGKIKSKKGCVKKTAAIMLAAAVAASVFPAARPLPVKAAEPYVSLRTSFKTLKTGQANRMTLKNNTLGWKIKKVSTKDRTVAMVYGKTASSFMIKGKSEGRTTVKAELRTTARKKFTKKTVRCRVKVIAADKLNPEEAKVSTQAELDKALKSRNLKKLEIHTDQAGKLVIPDGNYAQTDLIVYAPAADIENSGRFNSITLQAIKPDTWIENAIGNVMKVVAQAARIVVNQGACLDRLNFAKADAKVSLEVNGKINEVSISAKMELKVSGKPEEPIKTVIEETAEGTVLETSAPLHVEMHASAEITFNEGAENSTVEIKSEKVKADIKNNTKVPITIKRADGSIQKMAGTVNIFGGGSSTAPPSTYYPPVTGPSLIPTGPSIDTDYPGGGPGGSGGIGGGHDYVYIKEEAVEVMSPHVSIIVTRSAISAESETVTMSALLKLKMNLKHPSVPDAVKAVLYLPDVKQQSDGQMMIVSMKHEDEWEFGPVEADKDDITTDGKLLASLDVYDDKNHIYYSGDMYLIIINKDVLEQVTDYMKENGIISASLEIDSKQMYYSTVDWAGTAANYEFEDVKITPLKTEPKTETQPDTETETTP